MQSTNRNAEQTGQHDEQQWHCVRLQYDTSNNKIKIYSFLCAELMKSTAYLKGCKILYSKGSSKMQYSDHCIFLAIICHFGTVQTTQQMNSSQICYFIQCY